MTTCTNRSNAIRAARKALDATARVGEAFTLSHVEGGYTWAAVVAPAPAPEPAPTIVRVPVRSPDGGAAWRALYEDKAQKAERAKAPARRKAVYLKLHPETAAGVAGAHASNRVQGNASANSAPAFAADTAAASGRSERAVQRDNERGEKVTDAALDKVAGTPLDSGAYLDRLKDAPEARRGKSAAMVAAAARPEGITNTEIKAMTGWTKLGGFFGAVKRAGLVLNRKRENGDTTWFAVAAA